MGFQTSGSHSIVQQQQIVAKEEFRVTYVWRNIILFVFLHAGSLYGLYLGLTQAKWQTILFTYICYLVSGLGITAGAHRLWSHKAYKAKLPLRIFLAIGNTIAFQNSVYEWARDHRVHHKYTETDADPHNSNRGFFFAHIGWLLCRKHPDVLQKGKNVDCQDILNDPVVDIQKRYYLPLVVMACFVLPTVIPAVLWGETWATSYFLCSLFRYCFLLHMTWLVNSAAHMFGNRPYDTTIGPRENINVSLGALGEGFHNYHHTFPWDYKSSELGWKMNITTVFIDCMAAIGQAYDLREVDNEFISKRRARTGDTSIKTK